MMKQGRKTTKIHWSSQLCAATAAPEFLVQNKFFIFGIQHKLLHELYSNRAIRAFADRCKMYKNAKNMPTQQVLDFIR